MADKIAVNNGNKVEFFQNEHIYILNGLTKLKSTTTLVKEHFPTFDTQKIAAKYAKKNNLLVENVIAQWNKKRDDACEFGTLIHSWAELLLENQNAEIRPKTEKESLYLKSLREYIPTLLEEYEIIAIEMLLFDPESKIAGTPDIIAKNKSDGEIYILDWKTNEKIDFENRWENGLGILKDIPNANYYHYCLQLGIYASMLKKHYGYDTPIKGKILHIMSDRVEEIDTLDSFSDLADKLLG